MVVIGRYSKYYRMPCILLLCLFGPISFRLKNIGSKYISSSKIATEWLLTSKTTSTSSPPTSLTTNSSFRDIDTSRVNTTRRISGKAISNADITNMTDTRSSSNDDKNNEKEIELKATKTAATTTKQQPLSAKPILLPPLPNRTKPIRFLIGMTTMKDNIKEKIRRKIHRETYIRMYKDINKQNKQTQAIQSTTEINKDIFHENTICSLTEYMKRVNDVNDKMPYDDRNECQIIYTFVIGKNTTKNGNLYPPMLLYGENANKSTDMITSSSSSSSEESSEEEMEYLSDEIKEEIDTYNDITLLNIQETMRGGKSESWITYASTLNYEFLLSSKQQQNQQNQQQQDYQQQVNLFDFIGKIDSDSMLMVDRLIKSVYTNKNNEHYKRRAYGGMRIAKEMCSGRNWGFSCKHKNFIAPYFMLGGFNFISIDITQYSYLHGISINKFKKLHHPPHEDMSQANKVFCDECYYPSLINKTNVTALLTSWYKQKPHQIIFFHGTTLGIDYKKPNLYYESYWNIVKEKYNIATNKTYDDILIELGINDNNNNTTNNNESKISIGFDNSSSSSTIDIVKEQNKHEQQQQQNDHIHNDIEILLKNVNNSHSNDNIIMPGKPSIIRLVDNNINSTADYGNDNIDDEFTKLQKKHLKIVLGGNNNNHRNKKLKVYIFPRQFDKPSYRREMDQFSKHYTLNGCLLSDYVDVTTNHTSQDVDLWLIPPLFGFQEKHWYLVLGGTIKDYQKVKKEQQLEQYNEQQQQQQKYDDHPPIIFVDFRDHPKFKDYKKISQYVNVSKSFYALRSIVYNRYYNYTSKEINVGTINTFTKTDYYNTSNVSWTYVSNSPFRSLPFAIRSDIVTSIKDNILSKLSNKITTNATSSSNNSNYSNMSLVDIDLPNLYRSKDVVHFWPKSGGRKQIDRGYDRNGRPNNSNLRDSVSKLIDTMGSSSYEGEGNNNISTFAGLAGKANFEGRNDVSTSYIESMLQYKIIIVAQKDEWEEHYRLWEALCSGALVMTDIMLSLPKDFEDGKSIVVYKNINDLRNKILYYLYNEEERIQIASNGYNIALNRHRSWHRMEEVIFGKLLTSSRGKDF